jgi:hypothetical protein
MPACQNCAVTLPPSPTWRRAPNLNLHEYITVHKSPHAMAYDMAEERHVDIYTAGFERVRESAAAIPPRAGDCNSLASPSSVRELYRLVQLKAPDERAGSPNFDTLPATDIDRLKGRSAGDMPYVMAYFSFHGARYCRL